MNGIWTFGIIQTLITVEIYGKFCKCSLFLFLTCMYITHSVIFHFSILIVIDDLIFNYHIMHIIVLLSNGYFLTFYIL